ncbi:hypothetical protein Bra1253DRAFT_06730 [Bradyrhizobium sp. WSM1253]|nr:hypothetical protein Bra1253DRAFT_06730 [Bradyrhizobium sp. WSM1253]
MRNRDRCKPHDEAVRTKRDRKIKPTKRDVPTSTSLVQVALAMVLGVAPMLRMAVTHPASAL